MRSFFHGKKKYQILKILLKQNKRKDSPAVPDVKIGVPSEALLPEGKQPVKGSAELRLCPRTAG